ncbi:hypothetical protein B0H10DRAFT_1948661 [Mycena sp. CBHHK59/15]|nr:hypothetical protein B0H10DRAFT_1948661 [Mycena sp. CBHHK59/15]
MAPDLLHCLSLQDWKANQRFSRTAETSSKSSGMAKPLSQGLLLSSVAQSQLPSWKQVLAPMLSKPMSTFWTKQRKSSLPQPNEEEMMEVMETEPALLLRMAALEGPVDGAVDPLPDESTSKQRRVDDSMLPWAVDDFIIEGQLTPELAKSRAMLQEFAKDPKYVAGNLDKVITSHYSISHDKQRAETIGNRVQILFGSSKTTKSIRTQSDWIAAWTKAAKATVFVFPHRRRELDKYPSHIMDTFISCSENVHERILLDRKLCNEVAAHRDLLLSDFHHFGHWEHSFLSDHGLLTLLPSLKRKIEQMRKWWQFKFWRQTQKEQRDL